MTGGLDPFFHPRTVAVIGASRSKGKAGNTVLANVLEFGFKGAVYPVNPGVEEVMGLRAYPSLDQLPEIPDLAVGVLPRDMTLSMVEGCARAGVKHLIIPAAGFSDAGPGGREMEEEVIGVARSSGMRVMGPNSIGTVCPAGGLATSIVSLDRMEGGELALFGQTGMFASGIARWIDTSENFGISKIACLGNKADVDENDLLEYLREDVESSVVGFYTEGVRDGPRFRSALESLAERKPVLVVKSGRTDSGEKAIASHTGALCGSDDIYAGLIRQAGAVRVADFEELFDCAKALIWQPPPRGPRVGVVSITGVGCVLAADSAAEHALVMPPLSAEVEKELREVIPPWAPLSNPADIWAAIESQGAERAYTDAASALASDPSLDMLLMIFTLIPESELDPVRLFDSIRTRHPEKPLAAALMAGGAEMIERWKSSLESAAFPTYPSPERALRALGAAWELASHRA